jgi:hypothetical protein
MILKKFLSNKTQCHNQEIVRWTHEKDDGKKLEKKKQYNIRETLRSKK